MLPFARLTAVISPSNRSEPSGCSAPSWSDPDLSCRPNTTPCIAGGASQVRDRRTRCPAPPPVSGMAGLWHPGPDHRAGGGPSDGSTGRTRPVRGADGPGVTFLPDGCPAGSQCQSTTIPNGAPPGIATGEPVSSVSDVPSTAKALTFAAPASTTYR